MAIRRRTVSAPRPPAEYTPEIGARDALRIAVSKGLRNIPLDVVGLASSIGLQVEFLLLPDDVSGFLKRKDGGWAIGVNSRHHPNRQRFTIAHELGHYFLHRDQGDFTDHALFRRDLQNDHREYEANSFASKLLMPEHEFRDMAIKHPNLQEIANYFEVSPAAARFRVDALGQEHIFG
jgi:hypothetical protein